MNSLRITLIGGDFRASFDTLGFGSRLKILKNGVATEIKPLAWSMIRNQPREGTLPCAEEARAG
jgi:hypothetical protein